MDKTVKYGTCKFGRSFIKKWQKWLGLLMYMIFSRILKVTIDVPIKILFKRIYCTTQDHRRYDDGVPCVSWFVSYGYSESRIRQILEKKVSENKIAHEEGYDMFWIKIRKDNENVTIVTTKEQLKQPSNKKVHLY